MHFRRRNLPEMACIKNRSLLEIMSNLVPNEDVVLAELYGVVQVEIMVDYDVLAMVSLLYDETG